jgi:hypothetical protein
VLMVFYVVETQHSDNAAAEVENSKSHINLSYNETKGGECIQFKTFHSKVTAFDILHSS